MQPSLRCLLLLLAFFFSLSASAQQVSLSVKNESLEKVFQVVEQQTGYNFVYSAEQMQKAKAVTIISSNLALKNFLDKLFSNQPFHYRINEKHVVVQDKTPAVAKELRGRVMNEEGVPAVGISITLKNSGLAISTDGNGEFFFPNAPTSSVLEISGAEIEPMEFQVGERAFVLVQVKSRLAILDETIVIAYGKSSRRLSTGSVSKVQSSEIAKQPVADPLSALEGRVSGLQITQASGVPGSTITVRLRGQNSIANGNNPLYLIDGVPYPSATLSSAFGGGGGANSSVFSSLNPADIESIEVLKDADATAIYGSRGANGVILISTKKGKAGKAKLNLQFYTGAGAVTRKIDLLKTKDYLAVRREAFANDAVTPTTSNAPDLLLWDSTRYTDWQEDMIGGTMNNRDLSLNYSGGTENTQYLISSGYHKETTVYPGKFYLEKFSGGLQLSHQSVNKKLALTLSSQYNFSHSRLPIDDLVRFISLSPNTPPIYTPDGKLNWENSTWSNPYSLLNGVFNFESNNLLTNLSLSYKVANGLEARITGGFSLLSGKDHSITPRSYYNPALGITGIARFGNTSVKTLIAEPQLNYSKVLKAYHIGILVGATFQSAHTGSFGAGGTGYGSDDQLNSLRAAPTVILTDEQDIQYRYAGLFGRINADYKQRYLLSVTARRDGSSRYGPENRFAWFGSIGTGWIFSDEKFLRSKRLLSFGKIKASAGITGNDQIGDYKYLNLYTPYSSAYLNVRPLSPSQLFNPGFGWEKVLKYQAGIDLGFWNNRFLFSVVYYHNITKNQLLNYPLPTMSGFGGILRNIPSTIRNNGWEVELNTINLQSSKWKWTSSANLTIPKNKLIAYDGLTTSSYANTYVIGQSLFITKRYQSTGVDPLTGVYTFTDFDHSNTVNSPNDQQKIIFIGQQYYGGLENTIEYKKVSLSIALQFVRQKYAVNYLNTFSRPGALANEPTFILDRWRSPNDVSQRQRFTVTNAAGLNAYTYYGQSDAAYSNASYTRLRNLQLAYDLVNDRLRKFGFSVCRFTLSGQNLLTITKFKGLDPETKGLLPPVQVMTAGIQVTF